MMKKELEVQKSKSLMNLCYELMELDFDAPENKEYLEKTFKEVYQKIDSYFSMNSFCDSQIEMLKKEKEFLDKQIKAFGKIQDRLYDIGHAALKTLDVKEIKSENGHKIRLHKSTSVEVYDMNKLPSWAKKEFVTVSADKNLIKDAIKNGQEVEGARLVENESVVIK